MAVIVWTDVNAKMGISAIDHLFNRLTGIYGDRFRKGFPNEGAVKNWKDAWSDGLSSEGITLDEVRAGLSGILKTCDWPPTLPEFLRACRPSMDYEASFIEAVNGMQARRNGRNFHWSTPSVYWAAVQLGGDLSAYPYTALKSRWRNAIDEAVRQDRKEIPEPLEALPAPNKTYVNQEEARKRIASLAESLKFKV